MTYSPLIPQGEPTPKDQVAAIQTNFAQFAAIFASTALGIKYNHTPFNNANQGSHEAILFETQSIDPLVTENLDAIYSKNATSTSSTEPQLFLRIPKFLPIPINPSNPPTQLTFNQVNTAGPVYQSFLPGGYIFFFGSTSNIALNITLSPAPTQTIIAIAYPNNLTSIGTPIPFDVSMEIINPSTLKIHSTLASGVYSFCWMAIGKI